MTNTPSPVPYFDAVLPLLVQSRAYGKYCEHVYGKNLAQFNRADMEQLEKLLEVLNPKQGDHVLDVGCGNGKVTEYLAKVTGASFTGIDLSAKAIECAQDRASSIEFLVADMRDLPDFDHPFDAIISIDTVGNQPYVEVMLSSLTKVLKPKGQIVILHGETLPEMANKEPTADHTELFSTLSKVGFSITTFDFTENERLLWNRSKEIEESLKPLFEAEGTMGLYGDLVDDADDFRKTVASEQYRRFLFHGVRA